jgi:alkanesulfonate monooxygenase SsuD/methylene tetrahydromethanopterin reductase-like flavin-dependent oxidoreductase (luciferase family)
VATVRPGCSSSNRCTTVLAPSLRSRQPSAAACRLPFHHPVRLAVQLALLDNLSRGRIDVGVGKGTIYNEYEFVGHGLRSDDSRVRMEEAIDIIGRLWGGGPVTYNGKYFQVQVPQLRPARCSAPTCRFGAA